MRRRNQVRSTAILKMEGRHAMTKRAFFEMSASDADYVWQRLDRAETFVTSAPFESRAFAEAGECEVLSTFLHAELNESTLSRFVNLHMIATRSTGYDHVDLEYCR